MPNTKRRPKRKAASAPNIHDMRQSLEAERAHAVAGLSHAVGRFHRMRATVDALVLAMVAAEYETLVREIKGAGQNVMRELPDRLDVIRELARIYSTHF